MNLIVVGIGEMNGGETDIILFQLKVYKANIQLMYIVDQRFRSTFIYLSVI